MLHKILFAGPVGSGKTTAIATISDSGVAQTEARASDEVAQRKARTTVAMDYGTLHIDAGHTIQLVGTPGQCRFDFMWEILAEGAIGIVILVDNARAAPMDDLDYYLKAFQRLIDDQGGAVVIGVTRCDLGAGPAIAAYRDHLQRQGRRIPVFEIDARSREDVRMALLAMTALLDPSTRRTQ
jgi:uncharacterized protein